MTKMSPLLERARETLKIEIAGLEGLIKRLDSQFEKAVNLLFACRGKVILTGIGKSGLIAQKIAATLTSTGTQRFFYMQEKVLTVIWESLPNRM